MKFIVHEIKLWFKDESSESKSYNFLANKINVITGDATTGKTSFWSIIDYCLLASKINVANTINDKVLWFGLRFSINGKQISLARKTPSEGEVSNDVYFDYGNFPVTPRSNKDISEIKSFLDIEFGITDALRFPYGKDLGKSPFNISYRHFLLFNSLTETVIGAPETYFDTTFYGKDEYDKALRHIFDLVIGVNDMNNIKALERLQQIQKGLKKIETQQRTNEKSLVNFESSIRRLIEKCKENEFIEYSEIFDDLKSAIIAIQDVISSTKKKAENQKLFSEINDLYSRRGQIQSQINAITQYQKEYKLYKKNLKKSADSLQPIEFLNNKLSDQLLDSYDTKLFIESLEISLKNIKTSISRSITEPLEVNGDIKKLRIKYDEINKKIIQLNEIKKNNLAEGNKFIVLGEIKNEYEQIEKLKKNNPIDTSKLNSLNAEKIRLEKVPEETKQIRSIMKDELDKSIQRNYNLLKSLPAYKDYITKFDDNDMILKLYPPGQIFPLDNVGSKSNYMFMHLCVYIGLHEHMIKTNHEHVPQFLFIDQPSIPYFTGNDDKGNDDKTKLIDAFTLLNSFIEYITIEKKNHFQIFMVEHASEDYWNENNLTHFHTVDNFINGKGLIPNGI